MARRSCCNHINLRGRYSVQLSNLTTYMLYVRRLVALATMWHRCKIRAVGLQNNALQWHLGNDPIKTTILECHHTAYSKDDYSLILQCLEKKALIRLDYDVPLRGADMTAYTGFPVHGCISLSQRGYAVLELLETQGIR